MKKISVRAFAKLAGRLRRPFHANYLSMYSSVFGGIVTDPALMMAPIDDHMVHRGDGVFEALRCVEGNIYNMWAHLNRLERSASAIGIRLPMSTRAIGSIVALAIRAGNCRESVARLYVSRGPGGFGVNPYECRASHLYVVVTKMEGPFMKQHPEGARVGISRIPAKPPFFARVKSCNCLLNVLMKKEAVEENLDCVVSLQAGGFLAEGPTENMGIVTRNRALLFPKLENVLRGTTMIRVMDLAKKLVRAGDLARVGFADIRPADARRAAEAILVGTTRDVTRIREFDGRPVGNGRPGPVFEKLSALLLADMRTNREILTRVFEG
ncbi:MAG: aminotransferase class IV [Verrucomicrobiota bacterium]|nr:aminotransferase class IV [Verrucomicrobiota bacterium]